MFAVAWPQWNETELDPWRRSFDLGWVAGGFIVGAGAQHEKRDESATSVSLCPSVPTAPNSKASRSRQAGSSGLISNRALLLAPDSLPLKVGKALCERGPSQAYQYVLSFTRFHVKTDPARSARFIVLFGKSCNVCLVTAGGGGNMLLRQMHHQPPTKCRPTPVTFSNRLKTSCSQL